MFLALPGRGIVTGHRAGDGQGPGMLAAATVKETNVYAEIHGPICKIARVASAARWLQAHR